MKSQLEQESLALLSPEAWSLIHAAQLVLCDLDGCLAVENVPLSGAKELAEVLGDRLTVVSNNSTLRATELAATLAAYGLVIDPQAIYLAGEVAIKIVAAKHPACRALVVGSRQMRDLAQEVGLELTDERPDIVVLGRDDELPLHRAQKVVDALSRGAAFYLTNPDRSRPGRCGVPQIETGAVQLMLQAVLPQIQPVTIGKPSLEFFRHVLADHGTEPSRALMIGDNFETDIRGAAAAGMDWIWLRPGSRA